MLFGGDSAGVKIIDACFFIDGFFLIEILVFRKRAFILPALNIDAELLKFVIGGFFDLDLLLLFRIDLYIESKALKLLDKYLKGFRDTRLRYVFALNDGFVGLYPADNVV